MSLLLLGRDDRDGRRVVLKQILPELSRRKDLVQMFLTESTLAPRMGHPNIVRTLETIAEPVPTIVLEYVDGPHLGRVLRIARALEPLRPDMSVYVVTKVARALDYAHELRDGNGRNLGVVHRDISPANILL